MIADFPLVVVADDDPDILALVELRLLLIGCQVVTAVDGDGALAAVTEHVPALAVLDVAMPGINGLVVLERMRDNPATAAVPVILLSASVHDADVARGLAHGANSYVKKPFEGHELVSAVTSVLERRPQRIAS